MPTKYALNESLRRVVVTVTPDHPTTSVAQTVLELIRHRPLLGSWDWIFDIREPHQKASAEQLHEIAQAFNSVRSKESYTIFISADPATYDRCVLMDLKFLDRRHLVAGTMEEAEQLIPRVLPTIF